MILQQLTELRKALYSWLQFYYSIKIWRRTSQREKLIVWGLKGLQKWNICCPLCVESGCHTLWISQCMMIYIILPTREVHLSSMSRVFIEVSLPRHEGQWLNHWSSNWTQSPTLLHSSEVERSTKCYLVIQNPNSLGIHLCGVVSPYPESSSYC